MTSFFGAPTQMTSFFDASHAPTLSSGRTYRLRLCLALRQLPADARMFAQQRLRHVRTIRGQVLAYAFVLGNPRVDVDMQQRFEFGARQVESGEVEIARVRQVTDRRVQRILRAIAAADDPFEHAQIIAEAGPQEFAVLAFAEPVD